jgi:hypothetical protein
MYRGVITCEDGPLDVGERVQLVRGDGPREGETMAYATVILNPDPEPGEEGTLALDMGGTPRRIWPLGPTNNRRDLNEHEDARKRLDWNEIEDVHRPGVSHRRAGHRATSSPFMR